MKIRSHAPHAIDGTPLACQSRDPSVSSDSAIFVWKGFGFLIQEFALVCRFDLQKDLARLFPQQLFGRVSASFSRKLCLLVSFTCFRPPR